MLGPYNYPPEVTAAMNEMYKDPEFTRQILLVNGAGAGFVGVSLLAAAWQNAEKTSPENVARLQQARTDWASYGPVTDDAAQTLFAKHEVIAPVMKACTSRPDHKTEFKACVEQAIAPPSPADQHVGDFAAFGTVCTLAAAAALAVALRPRRN